MIQQSQCSFYIPRHESNIAIRGLNHSSVWKNIRRFGSRVTFPFDWDIFSVKHDGDPTDITDSKNNQYHVFTWWIIERMLNCGIAFKAEVACTMAQMRRTPRTANTTVDMKSQKVWKIGTYSICWNIYHLEHHTKLKSISTRGKDPAGRGGIQINIFHRASILSLLRILPMGQYTNRYSKLSFWYQKWNEKKFGHLPFQIFRKTLRAPSPNL